MNPEEELEALAEVWSQSAEHWRKDEDTPEAIITAAVYQECADALRSLLKEIKESM